MVNGKVCVVIMAAGDRVLLLKRGAARNHEWQPVTGNLDGDETPAAGAIREVAEETGFSGGRLVPTDLVIRFTKADRAFEEHVFAYVLDQERVPALSHEHVAHEWIEGADAAGRVAYNGQRTAIGACRAVGTHG